LIPWICRQFFRTCKPGATREFATHFKKDDAENMRILRRPPHRRQGAALVEAALILPIFFMVVLGIVEFGRSLS
jgi:hypothetical protein